MVGESEIQLVTVTGEPGVGKTRLLARVPCLGRRPARARPTGARAGAFRTATASRSGRSARSSRRRPASSSPTIRRKRGEARQALTGVDDAEWLEDAPRPARGAGAWRRDGSRGVVSAWQRFIEAIAAHAGRSSCSSRTSTGPTPRSSSSSSTSSTGRRACRSSCSARRRPELYESHPAWGGGKRNSTTVALSPLSQEETARLVAALLDTAVLPAETQSALLDRAGGNPLYAEEYARLFLELGSAEDLPLPDTVQGLIAARLDTLPPDRKALLQDAAVIGKVFWAGALECDGRARERGRPRRPPPARAEGARAARAALVRRRPGRVHLLACAHPRRGVRPDSALCAGREALAVADWIEEMAGEARRPLRAARASHDGGDRSRAGIGEASSDPELELRAARYLVLAGDRAVSSSTSARRPHATAGRSSCSPPAPRSTASRS